jgi:hypothetical protein
MSTPTKIKIQGVILRRIHMLNPREVVKWEVISQDGLVRIGIIRQYYDEYLGKRIGWQTHPIKYWLGSRFYPQELVIGMTRKEVIEKLKK